jgi:hypothetical protein
MEVMVTTICERCQWYLLEDGEGVAASRKQSKMVLRAVEEKRKPPPNGEGLCYVSGQLPGYLRTSRTAATCPLA